MIKHVTSKIQLFKNYTCRHFCITNVKLQGFTSKVTEILWVINYKLRVRNLLQFSSVQLLSCLTQSDSLWPHGLPHIRLPCSSPIPRGYSNSCPSSRWCHPNISFSVIPFSSCLQSFPASGSIQMSWFFPWGGHITGLSVSALVLPMNTQDWSPLGWTGWISLQSKGLSRVFSNTTVQKHQFLSD